MVALYDYDPTENSPNVDGDVSPRMFMVYIATKIKDDFRT